MNIMDNEQASIQGLALFFLSLIFGFSAYEWLTLPMSNGVATAVTAFWSVAGSTPDAAYQAGFANISALNAGHTVAMMDSLLALLDEHGLLLRARDGQ